jgi:hypothetical protein
MEGEMRHDCNVMDANPSFVLHRVLSYNKTLHTQYSTPSYGVDVIALPGHLKPLLFRGIYNGARGLEQYCAGMVVRRYIMIDRKYIKKEENWLG